MAHSAWTGGSVYTGQAALPHKNIQLRTADFAESQPFTLRIVIIYYYFKGESWTAATSKIGATNSADYVTKVCDACAKWDKAHVFKERG